MHIALVYSSSNVQLNNLVEIENSASVYVIDDRQIAFNAKDDKKYLSISFDNSVRELMSDEERTFLNKKFKEWNAFVFFFYDFEVFLLFVRGIPEEYSILIDNDNGCLYSKPQILKCSSFEEFFSNGGNVQNVT